MSIEPITRLQRFLRVLADSSADMPEPLRNLEKCCCYACGHLDTRPELHTTLEKLIASVRDKSIVPPKPNTRLEKYVAAMAGVWDDELPYPITREDKILFEAASGEDVTLSGNPLILENCIGGKALKALHVYGKSTQDGTPSPDNPVPIASAGDGGTIRIKITGKNLISTEALFSPTKSAFDVIDGHIKGTAKTKYAQIGYLLQSGYPAQYTASVSGGSETVGTELRAYKWVDGKLGNLVVQGFSPVGQRATISFSTDGKSEYFVFFRPYDVSDFDYYDMQLEIGTTATSFEPYHEQTLTLPTPNGLPGIPVTSGGNYTDPSGQQWVCDEVDLERGVMVQRVNRLKLDDLSWRHELTATNKNDAFVSALPTSQQGTTRGYTLCQYAVFNGIAYDTEMKESCRCYVWSNSATLQFKVGSGVNSVDALSEWLKARPDARFFYCLATSVETPLTPAEIAAYKSLTTYAPTTVLQATDGAGLEATYKCNVRKAEKTINDLYAELTAELEA